MAARNRRSARARTGGARCSSEEIRSELGPGFRFRDFEFEDIHPKAFVRKHVLDGDGLGLAEIRSALDPRAELTQVADVVREAAGERSQDAESVSPTKGTQTGSPTPAAAFDPDAT
ncbi:preprotein translocase [Streptomyces sp. NPDC048278]|uniref:preprotein translocase n=1 Tax=Streptomyces sp. NPDC048278 TaxID=3155809 RepID=UPI003413AA57